MNPPPPAVLDQAAVDLEAATELASVPGAVVAKTDVLKVAVLLAAFVQRRGGGGGAAGEADHVREAAAEAERGLEAELSSLWDMSAVEAISRFINEQGMLPLLVAVLEASESTRTVELAVGVLANVVSCVAGARRSASADARLLALVTQQLIHASDTAMLNEVVRLCRVIVTHNDAADDGGNDGAQGCAAAAGLGVADWRAGVGNGAFAEQLRYIIEHCLFEPLLDSALALAADVLYYLPSCGLAGPGLVCSVAARLAPITATANPTAAPRAPPPSLSLGAHSSSDSHSVAPGCSSPPACAAGAGAGGIDASLADGSTVPAWATVKLALALLGVLSSSTGGARAVAESAQAVCHLGTLARLADGSAAVSQTVWGWQPESQGDIAATAAAARAIIDDAHAAGARPQT